MRKLARRPHGSALLAELSVVVPEDWTPQDVVLFKTTFNTTAVTVAVPNDVELLWRAWRRRYGVTAASLFLVEFTTTGVRRAMLPNDIVALLAGGGTP